MTCRAESLWIAMSVVYIFNYCWYWLICITLTEWTLYECTPASNAVECLRNCKQNRTNLIKWMKTIIAGLTSLFIFSYFCSSSGCNVVSRYWHQQFFLSRKCPWSNQRTDTVLWRPWYDTNTHTIRIYTCFLWCIFTVDETFNLRKVKHVDDGRWPMATGRRKKK